MITEQNLQAVHGLIETTQLTLRHINGTWEYQLLNNLDEIRASLKQALPEAEQKQVEYLIETAVKAPLRRQMGRLRAVSRSLEEIQRHLKNQ